MVEMHSHVMSVHLSELVKLPNDYAEHKKTGAEKHDAGDCHHASDRSGIDSKFERAMPKRYARH